MARRSQKPPVVFLTGTLTEFVGNRDQPHALFSRAVLFLLGPAGTGKTTVARQYLGFDAPMCEKMRCSSYWYDVSLVVLGKRQSCVIPTL
jgi:ABC-type sulfate/molybdate transport systems ATPase subunit